MTFSPYTNLKQILFSAGIRITEAAKLFEVNRQTLYNWEKDELLFYGSRRFPMIDRMAQKIKIKTKEGYLPLKPCSSKERMKRLLNMLN
jgi:DNA-binding XRE family transcriptional regulator